MNEQTNPTAEQIMAFDDKYSLTVEVRGWVPLGLNASGETELGSTDELDMDERPYCTLYIGDHNFTFAGVRDPDDLLINLVNSLHDKTSEQAISYVQSDDFPYHPENEYDIHFPSIEE
ncbi:hypothetical protein ACQR3P_29135 [Rhodococcus sp. IEGM1300]